MTMTACTAGGKPAMGLYVGLVAKQERASSCKRELIDEQ